MACHEIELRPEIPEPYVKQALTDGCQLARFLLGCVDFAAGRFHTYWERNDAPNAVDMREGADIPQSASRSWLAQWIGSFLSESADNVCVFEDYEASPGDPWLKDAKSRLAFVAGEVYHVLTHRDTDMAMVRATIGESQTAWVSIGCTAQCATLAALAQSRSQTLSVDVLREVAEGCRGIIASAYDGEGFVVWRPS